MFGWAEHKCTQHNCLWQQNGAREVSSKQCLTLLDKEKHKAKAVGSRSRQVHSPKPSTKPQLEQKQMHEGNGCQSPT